MVTDLGGCRLWSFRCENRRRGLSADGLVGDRRVVGERGREGCEMDSDGSWWDGLLKIWDGVLLEERRGSDEEEG